MKLSVNIFAPIVHYKSKNILSSLESKGIEVLGWENRKQSDGVIIFNIHRAVQAAIRESHSLRKPILSLQEGMFPIGWKKTLPFMRSEAINANNKKVMQFVWSRFEQENYIQTGKSPNLIKHFGNPEHDDLFLEPKTTRKDLGIPKDAFVVLHIDQYAHPQTGPRENQLGKMRKHIQGLCKISDKVWHIRCVHPRVSSKQKFVVDGRSITKPFSYPIFDIIKLSDIVVTLSSTEGLTAAILGKPIIEYDISGYPERWPFVKHGVAVRANNKIELADFTRKALNGDLTLHPKVDYKKEYHVDGNITDRTANEIIKYFEGCISS